MQQCVQRGVVIMPIMVTQDEAMIDGNNRRSLIPVYATLGWIRAKWRNAKWARVLLGYLPSLKEEELPNVSDSRCRAIKRQLHKAAMQKLLRPLKKTMGKGAIAVIVTNTSSVTTYWSYQVCSAHGQWHERTVVPTIAFGSYDNPETKKVAGVKDGYRNMAMFCVL